MLFAISLTITNTQDSIYICAGSARDVVAKAFVISALKPPLVLLAAGGGIQASSSPYVPLVLALLVPSLVAGVAWQVLRAPQSVQQIIESTPIEGVRLRDLLGVGYLYALSSSLVSWGVPAMATNTLAPSISALFYVAWTIASLVGSVSAAVANVVVSRARRAGEVLNATRIVIGQGGFLLGLATVILLVAPLFLQVFGNYYQSATPILAVLLVGQACSGIGAVLIGFARRTAPATHVVVAVTTWVIGGFGVPALAARSGAVDFLGAYALGSAVALGLVVLELRPAASRRGVPA
jgi:hypothetical protein